MRTRGRMQLNLISSIKFELKKKGSHCPKRGGDRRSEVGGRRSEVGGRRSEVGRRGSAMCGLARRGLGGERRGDESRIR